MCIAIFLTTTAIIIVTLYFRSALQCPVDSTAFAKKHVSDSDMTSV